MWPYSANAFPLCAYSIDNVLHIRLEINHCCPLEVRNGTFQDMRFQDEEGKGVLNAAKQSLNIVVVMGSSS